MKRSNRILIGLVFIELLLGGIGAWLLYQAQSGGFQLNVSKAEFGARVGETIGGAMGALGAFMLIMWFLARRREKQDGER